MINFEATLNCLDEKGVRFIIVGGYAAVVHGAKQLTQDLDICYERTPENIKRLVEALAPYHPKLRGAPENIPFVFDERTIFQGMNFTLATDLGDLDLLGDLSGVGQFSQLSSSAETVQVFGRTYKVAALDTLIRSKRAAGRAKDLAVLPELEALKEISTYRKKPKKEL